MPNFYNEDFLFNDMHENKVKPKIIYKSNEKNALNLQERTKKG